MRWNVFCVETEKKEDWISRKAMVLSTTGRSVSAVCAATLYGAEVKFYSARLQLTEELETALPNFFAAGDGAGVTRGLAQAGASGVQAARAVVKRM